MSAWKFKNMHMILLFSLVIFSDFEVYGLSYDHSFTHECLSGPLKPQYGGGIVENPEMNEGVKGWSIFGGSAKLADQKSEDGNNFIVTFDRNATYHSLAQKFELTKGTYYTISAWLRVNEGESDVTAVFKTTQGFRSLGSAIARSGCWSMLKGGFVANVSGPAFLYFDNNHPTVELWADSISIQPFTEEEWISHRTQSTEKARKGKVRFQAVDSQGQPLANANITIKQLRSNFPFGCAISSFILKNPAYQNWFFSKGFKVTVFENEMKWYTTENSPGHEDYSVPDAMLKLVQQHNIQVRGHNVFWDDPNGNPAWVKPLSGSQLQQAADKRINSVVRRYQGQLIHWDVVNENIHFSFFENGLHNPAASANFYHQANHIDGKATPFLNEYNTIEQPGDKAVSPAAYFHKINQIRAQGYRGPLGIGLEGHFGDPNIAYIRSGIDSLSSLRLPIWVTELDVSDRPTQAAALEQIIMELIAHPGVQGIIVWGAISPAGCYRMCLTDQNFKNLPTGDVIDKILGELRHEGFVGVTNADGFFEASLFHGEYDFHFSHPNAVNSSILEGVKVSSTSQKNSIVRKVMVRTV